MFEAARHHDVRRFPDERIVVGDAAARTVGLRRAQRDEVRLQDLGMVLRLALVFEHGHHGVDLVFRYVASLDSLGTGELGLRQQEIAQADEVLGARRVQGCRCRWPR